jgi:hypothetical protein
LANVKTIFSSETAWPNGAKLGRKQMKKLYRGPYIDAFCQAWFHLVQLFQRSRLKYEKLTDGRRSPSDGNTSHDPLGNLLHLVPFGQETWPLLLKIEHMVKLHVFGNNSKTVNNKI